MSRERGRASAWEHPGVARRLELCTPSHSHSWRLRLQGGWSLCLTTVSESLAGAGQDRVGVYSQPPLWKRPAGSATTPALGLDRRLGLSSAGFPSPGTVAASEGGEGLAAFLFTELGRGQ